MTSDLVFLSTLFKLVTCKLDVVMSFDLLSLLIEIIICFLEGSFIVMLILGFIFPEPLIKLWIFSIFLAKRFEKFYLSLKISSTFGANASVYDCLFLDLAIFLLCYLSS